MDIKLKLVWSSFGSTVETNSFWTPCDHCVLKGSAALAIAPILKNRLCHNLLKVRVVSVKYTLLESKLHESEFYSKSCIFN